MESGISLVECQTRNQVSPGSNPPLPIWCYRFGRLWGGWCPLSRTFSHIADYHFSFVLSLTQMLVFLSLYLMLNILFPFWPVAGSLLDLCLFVLTGLQVYRCNIYVIHRALVAHRSCAPCYFWRDSVIWRMPPSLAWVFVYICPGSFPRGCIYSGALSM